MTYRSLMGWLLAGASCVAVCATGALAASFDIPRGDLASALDAYSAQSGVAVIVSANAAKNAQTQGLKGDFSAPDALSRILKGTGFTANPSPSGVVEIVGGGSKSSSIEIPSMQLAQAAPPRAAVETVTVTSSKLGGADVQSIPIAITALSQEQLTATQTAGGPDLIKNVPNMTFTKTNFTGYSIQIRGIGTQAISVTTDPAVAVALNDTPFIRNHFFEQEFYDLSQAEVLRGPQGTLYGRNATAGVVNLVTAKPTDQFEAMASGDIGNYKNRRFEGMINIPILDDRIDLRVAGEWTKRSGYTINENTGNSVDGRDLWSGRVSLTWKPLENLQATVVWEHFSEDDDRMRTAKQLCHQDPGLSSVLGTRVQNPVTIAGFEYVVFTVHQGTLSQGCLPASLYSPESFQVPYGYSLPYVIAGYAAGSTVGLGMFKSHIDPYAGAVNSPDLREIETQIDPVYKAKNDTIELNADYNINPQFTFTSSTGFNQDFLWSTEDYNRFNTQPGAFKQFDCMAAGPTECANIQSIISPDGIFCDPQLGCSDRLVAQDVSSEHAWQLSQEFRLASHLEGPLNFSVGGNYMHYETEEDYYVFANTLTAYSLTWDAPYVPGVSDNSGCVEAGEGYQYHTPRFGTLIGCKYVDPNSLQNLNGDGHNYFRSQNPYLLDSYAGFGEVYYNILQDLKLTGGIRWTNDQKHFVDIPSELLVNGYGYISTGVVDQSWSQLTGRVAANWTPKLDFTDQTLIYGSWAHGYKAGGANPPGAVLTDYNQLAGTGIPVHPLTFNPEFVNAYELGTKNTLLDGGLTLNGDVFFYDYKGYQISEIVDRTAINLNFDATVKGAELEATYEPVPGLRFKFAGGYEHTRINDGQSAVDLMDRTAGHAGWILMKPFVSEASNCVIPDYVIQQIVRPGSSYSNTVGGQGVSACGIAYNAHFDPLTSAEYTPFPFANSNVDVALRPYPGFDPSAGTPDDPYTGQNTYNGVDYGPAPNNGEGFSKNLGGNELPNAPRFTVSFSAEYTVPLTAEWAGTFHTDYYWQDYSWARVFNDNPYDRLRGYTNINLALILTSQSGWQVMGYVKNIFNTTAITGAFLNSDDSGLTTNVFLTDPRLFGVRVTRNW